MNTKEEINTIVEKLMTLIRALPDGTESNLDDLLGKLDFSSNLCNEDRIRLLHKLLEAARKESIFLETDYLDSIIENQAYRPGFAIYHNTPSYWFCGVGFKELMTVFFYLSDNGFISPNSFVEVPYGNKGNPVIGRVLSCGVFKDSTSPFSADHANHINRIAAKEEYDAQPELEIEQIT